MGAVRRKGGRVVGVDMDVDDVAPEEIGAWLEMEGRLGVDVSHAPRGLSHQLDARRRSSNGGRAKAVADAADNEERNEDMEASYRRRLAKVVKARKAGTEGGDATWTDLTDAVGAEFDLSGRQVRNILKPRKVPRP